MIITALKNLDEALDELKEHYEGGGVEFQFGEESYVATDGIIVEFPALGISATEGIVLEKQDGEYMPDWDITLIFKTGAEPQSYYYYEQDCLTTSLHNYLNYTGDSEKETGDLECIIKCDEDDE